MRLETIEARLTAPNATGVRYAEVVRRRGGYVAFRSYSAMGVVEFDDGEMYVNDPESIGKLLRAVPMFLQKNELEALGLDPTSHDDREVSTRSDTDFDSIYTVTCGALDTHKRIPPEVMRRAFEARILSWITDEGRGDWPMLAELLRPENMEALIRPDMAAFVPRGLLEAGIRMRAAMADIAACFYN